MPSRDAGIEIRDNADGTRSYRVRWREGGGRTTGRFRSRQFSGAGARARARRFRAELEANGWREPSPTTPAATGPPAGTTLTEWATRHALALTGVGDGYRAQYLRDVRRHLAPFADRPLAAVTELDVREWLRGLEAGTHPWLMRPAAPATIRRLLTQAASAVAAAQSAGLVDRNVFRGHRLPRRDRDAHQELTVLTHEEWAILRDCLPAGPYRDLCTVLIGTGMRWGEATALAVGSVEPMTRPPRLHVAQAWQDDGRGGYQLGTPKSVRSRRTLTITTAVLDALIPHLSAKTDDQLVFTTPGGAPVRSSNFRYRVWEPALRAAGERGMTKRPRIHDLRHSHASWLIAGGRTAVSVQRRLGHESVQTTERIYVHLLPQVDADDLAALEVAMGQTARSH